MTKLGKYCGSGSNLSNWRSNLRSGDPYGVLSEMNEMFENIFDNDFFAPRGWRAMPLSTATRKTMNVRANEEKMTLSVDVPGVKLESIKITVKENEVSISTKRGESVQDYRYLINQDYDPGSCGARLEDGVLTLEFDRCPETKPREIEVKVC